MTKKKQHDLEVANLIYAYSYQAKLCRGILKKLPDKDIAQQKALRDKKKHCYARKKELLSRYQPLAIHYSVFDNQTSYFLYYEIADKKFHQPISAFEVVGYPQLPRLRLADHFVSYIPKLHNWSMKECEKKYRELSDQ